MSDDPVLVHRDDTTATVVLNRPEKLNALDLAAWRRLAAAFSELDADEHLRCIVVRGAGRAFASGADIAEFGSERSDREEARRYGRVVDEAMGAVAACRHPTVAMIHGACVGGGLELACACDLRICGATSRFGVPVSRLGLTMAYGELRFLLEVVGPAVAREVLLTGEIFSSRWARQVGLVHRVVADVALEPQARALVRRIAEGAPLVHRWHKEFIRRLADPAPLTDEEVDEGIACFDTADFREGTQAFLEKRPPRFEGK